jgi:hypothetical protein
MPVHASEIRFGVEIECCLPIGHCPHRGAYHHGRQISWAPNGWNAQRDSSLRPPAGYKAVEVVSPILRGEAGLRELLQVVDSLNDKGMLVNESCGMHIHVDGNVIDAYHLSVLKESFKQFELTFFGLNGDATANRMQSDYCATSDQWDRTANGHFCSLNTSNWFNSVGKRTVEFRCWQATTDLDDILTAVCMSVALVAGVINDQHMPEGKSARDLGFFLDAHRIVPEVPIFDLVLNLHNRNKQAWASPVAGRVVA